MGSCWCKEKNDEREAQQATSVNDDIFNFGDNIIHTVSANIPNDYYLRSEKGCPDSETVDKLIIETLGVIGTLVDK